ncbi:CaiB/BaiF CoA-transferase family protein [Xanthobacter sp. VNH20]|uniref:CaiB/BaiF CoA transferase family protein n=1 Tax=Xanthobacter sp. VNH20 TaxID=3156616 RepID=UPI0032B51DEA
MRPLEGLLVLDFSTLLPGPLASLILAEAGARVVKIERPGRGDEMRTYEPKVGDDSVNFLLLNRGKQSIALDLKAPDAISRLRPLIERADVLIEQFRPGVMNRLGLGYEAVRRMNSSLVYCSITGWGQNGPKADIAAHDLNYMAETGVLGLSVGADGAPVLPPVLAADVAGGTYPAVINILLALKQRDQSGRGTYLDIAMGENLFTFMYWGLGNGFAAGAWPHAGGELVTGGTPRYHIYRTADARYVAAAPLEDKFWENFCRLIDLPQEWRAASAPAGEVTKAVGAIIAAKSAAHWRALFAGQDVCCSIVATLEEAVNDPHFAARQVFAHRLLANGRDLPALPVPVVPAFRSATSHAPAPRLGETLDPLLSI